MLTVAKVSDRLVKTWTLLFRSCSVSSICRVLTDGGVKVAANAVAAADIAIAKELMGESPPDGAMVKDHGRKQAGGCGTWRAANVGEGALLALSSSSSSSAAAAEAEAATALTSTLTSILPKMPPALSPSNVHLSPAAWSQ